MLPGRALVCAVVIAYAAVVGCCGYCVCGLYSARAASVGVRTVRLLLVLLLQLRHGVGVLVAWRCVLASERRTRCAENAF